MNEKFFSLPEEKQQRIINAGFRVFSQNSYKKSPMSEIAAEAGISKSLLFHYFKNKQELYLFLWETCGDISIEYLTKHGCYEEKELFDMMFSGMKAKIEIMKIYPNIGDFAIRAFYEKDPDIHDAIMASYQKYFNLKARGALAKLDPDKFIPGIDLDRMYREMYLASEGYMFEMIRKGPIDPEQLEKDFTGMLDFWKSIYLRKENNEEETHGNH